MKIDIFNACFSVQQHFQNFLCFWEILNINVLQKHHSETHQILLLIEKYLCNSGCSDWQSGQDFTFKAFFPQRRKHFILKWPPDVSIPWKNLNLFDTRGSNDKVGDVRSFQEADISISVPFFLTFIFHFSHSVFSTSLYRAFLRSSVPTVAAGVTHPSLLMSVAATA